MSLANFQKIIDQSKGKVVQIALGGRGNPDQHPNFKEIMESCVNANITVNYTTSGMGLTEEAISITKKSNAGVAVSWQRAEHTNRALARFINAGCYTNIHFVLGDSTIDEAIAMLKRKEAPVKGLENIIFLLYKPVGTGADRREMLTVHDNPRLQDLLNAVTDYEHDYGIGFDTCIMPFIATTGLTKVVRESVEACEAARFSAYISPDMHLYPCSFDISTGIYKVSLENMSIKDAWESNLFETFRNKMARSCPGCPNRETCFGGCHMLPQLTICNRKERE